MNKKQISISIGLVLFVVPLVMYHKNILREINEASLERHSLRRKFRGLFK